MSDAFNCSRRVFLKLAGGTVLLTVRPASALAGAKPAEASVPAAGGGWARVPGKANYRIEGPRKVTGQKIFARDFRAKHMPGWPQSEKVALILRAIHADRPVLNLNLTMLPFNLQPERIITQTNLDRDQISTIFIDQSAYRQPPGMFVAVNQVPVYQGQPVAMLIFSDYETYRQAAKILQFQDQAIVYGEPVKLDDHFPPYSNPTYLTLYDKEFSQVGNGYANPYAEGDAQKPVDLQARQYREKIDQDIVKGGWAVFKATRSTQMIAPSFMEPECGLGWFDRTESTLHLLLGTQSPDGDVQSALDLFAKPACPIRISRVELTTCYPGGGFGGRDESPFSALMILAAVYAEGPVRIARDRYAQFQGGLTRIRSNYEQTIALDKDLKFQALQVRAEMPAGGKRNYSQFVASLAGLSSGGGYYFPKAAIDAWAQPTRAPIGGSMRGFGGTQAAFALETMIDEVARALKVDPFALRLKNVQQDDGNTVSGAPQDKPARFAELCQLAQNDKLWKDRDLDRERWAREGRLYGVGFALANQAYGTSGDGVMANIGILPDGQVLMRTNAVDMGNGSATTLGIACAEWLGRNASQVAMGELDVFKYLNLSKNPVSSGRSDGANWSNPNYTASVSMSSSACLTAFQQVHVATQAARVLYVLGILPAAYKLWGKKPPLKDLVVSQWKDGVLKFPNLTPLNYADLVAVMHGENGIVEVTVHGYFSVVWCRSLFEIDDQRYGWWPIDGLVTRTARSQNYDTQSRFNVKPPPADSKLYGRSKYAPSATLAGVSIDRATGIPKVESLHTYLDAGKIHQLELVSGQYQGGAAMGIGYALLENAPPGED